MSVRRRVPRKREEDPGGVGLSYVAPPPAPIRVNVAFFGHSYVNHMRTYVDSRPQEIRTASGEGELHFGFFGVSGGYIDTVCDSPQYERLRLFRPRMTFLSIGGNDVLPNQPPGYVAHFARRIGDLALKIEEEVGGQVKIVNLEYRSNPVGLSKEEFGRIKNGVNKYMRVHHPMKLRFVSAVLPVSDCSVVGVHLDPDREQPLFDRLVRLARKLIERDEGYINLRNPHPPIIFPQ